MTGRLLGEAQCLPVGPRPPLPLACPPRAISQEQWPDTFTAAAVSALIRRNSTAFLSLSLSLDFKEPMKTRDDHMIRGNTPLHCCRHHRVTLCTFFFFSSLNKGAGLPQDGSETRHSACVRTGCRARARFTEPKGCYGGGNYSLLLYVQSLYIMPPYSSLSNESLSAFN